MAHLPDTSSSTMGSSSYITTMLRQQASRLELTDCDDTDTLTHDSDDDMTSKPETPSIQHVFATLDSKARDRVIQQTFEKNHKSHIARKGISAYITEYVEDNKYQLTELDKQVLQRHDKWELESMIGSKIQKQDVIGYWVTVSPEPGTVTAQDLVARAQKLYCKDSQMFSGSMFVIEQSGLGDTLGYHPHLHILLRLDKGQASAELARAYKTIMKQWDCYFTKGNPKNFCCIKPVSINTFPKKIEYMLGKKDVDKESVVKADIEWRNINSFLPYYTYERK